MSLREFWRRLWGSKAPEAAPATPAAAEVSNRPGMRISGEALAKANVTRRVESDANPFRPYRPAPGVVPEGDPVLAMDEAEGTPDWALSMAGAFAEGQQFMGYPALALLAQRPEYRVISETIATEMTRKWIKLVANDGGDKSDKIAKINAEMERLSLRDRFREIAEQDGFFGRSHLFLDFGNDDDGAELKTSIGSGSDDTSKAKIKKDSLQAVRTVEAVWVYPSSYNSINPLKPSWYKPDGWYVMGLPVHSTRLLTFVGREVPDLLKPAYAFGGLSMSQMAKPYVNNWLDVREGVTAIVKAFSTFVLLTDATSILSGGAGESFYARLDIFNRTRNNRGVLAIDKAKEDFKNVSAPLGTLDHLQAQAQEHMASVSRIPLVKLTGISPSGLNASSEGELKCFEDHINSYQEAFYRPNLTSVIGFIQLSLFGEVDSGIGIEFEPLNDLTEKEEAELRKINADTGEVLIRSKAVSYMEERQRVTSDPDGPYSGVNPEDPVVFPMTEPEKADVATKVASAVAALVGESIIDVSVGLKELRKSSIITDFGTEITDADIEDAENEPPIPAETDPTIASGAAPMEKATPPQTEAIRPVA